MEIEAVLRQQGKAPLPQNLEAHRDGEDWAVRAFPAAGCAVF